MTKLYLSNTTHRNDTASKLKRLEARVTALEEMLRAGVSLPKPGSALGDLKLGELPNSLTKSLQAMRVLGEADASAVGQKTGRNRSVETIYLNQLVRLGALARKRVGKKVFFRLANLY
jgi:hypothetical protein